MTGRHKPVTKAPVPVKPELTADVAKLRSAAQAGGVAKPKLDPEVKGALERIKLLAHQGKDAIGTVLADLEPSVAKEVFKNLPSLAKADIATSTPHGSQPASVRMAQVQNLSDAQLQDIAEAMRSGLVEDLGLQLAVGTELAARTQWGKDHPEVVEYQRQAVVEGKVRFAEGRGAGRTETSGEITMDPSLKRSPEALAAALAHEATHSHHATNGGMDASIYAEETAGNLASAQVWSEIGKPQDAQLSPTKLETLNEYARLYKSSGEDGVQTRVAAEYAAEAANAAVDHSVKASELSSANKPRAAAKETERATAEAAKVSDVVTSLASDSGAVKAMEGVYAFEVARAVFKTGDSGNIEKLAKTFKNLSPAAKKDLLERLKDLPAAVKSEKAAFLEALTS